MKKYLKRGLAVLTCTAMCIQSPLMTLAEEVQRTNGEVSAYQVDNYGVATQALEEPQWKKVGGIKMQMALIQETSGR